MTPDLSAAFALLAHPRLCTECLDLDPSVNDAVVDAARGAAELHGRTATERLKPRDRTQEMEAWLSDRRWEAALRAASDLSPFAAGRLAAWAVRAAPPKDLSARRLAWAVVLRHAAGGGRPGVPVLAPPDPLASLLPLVSSLVDRRQTEVMVDRVSRREPLAPDILDMVEHAVRNLRAAHALESVRSALSPAERSAVEAWAVEQGRLLGIPAVLLQELPSA